MRSGVRILGPGGVLRALLVVTASVLTVMVATSSHSAIERRPVLTKKGIGEFLPARGGDWLTWQENSRSRLSHYDVFARRDGGRRFRVNAVGEGAVGGIDGSLLVYQQWKGGQSNIRFMDLATRQRFSPRVFINSKLWEYWPSISGDWVLFGRRNAASTRRKIFLFNRSTLKHRILDLTASPETVLLPGQVNGNWAVWHRCKPPTKCDVYRYNINLRVVKRIPNPSDRSQYAASVTLRGTVFFARGSRECGRNVSLMRYTPGGGLRKLTVLRPRRDVGDTYAATTARGDTALFFEQNTCDQVRKGTDVFKIRFI